MAKLENTQNISLTSAGGTFTLDLTTKVEVVDVRSSGTIILVAPIVINHTSPSLGTPADLHVKFRWTANVVAANNTVTVFGRVLPYEILERDFIIDCHNNGSAWEVKCLLDYDSMQDSLTNYVGSDTDSSNAVTINTTGFQILRTITTTNKQQVYNTGDKLILTASGTCSNSANSKAIQLAINDGSSTIGIGTIGGVFQSYWFAQATFIVTDFVNGEFKLNYFLQNGNESSVESVGNLTVPAFNYLSRTWNFFVSGREITPTGGEITLHSFNVERILV